MATRSRNVEILAPHVTVQEGADPVAFGDILRFMESRESHVSGKSFKFMLLDNPVHDHYIEGIVITTQDSDIPPKRNKETGVFSAVDIDTRTEGFGYANVFLYDTSRNVFVYEINKNGCYPKQLIEAVYNNWNNPTPEEEVRTPFNLTLNPFVRLNEYHRMLQMSYYKRISVELANPQALINALREENDSLGRLLRYSVESAFESNAYSLRFEQTALDRRLNPGGLSHNMVQGMVDKVLSKCRGEIRKLEVQGYAEDIDDSRRCRPIDLLADTFNESFRIEDIQIHTNLQIAERKTGVENLYNRILPEIRQILGR